MIMQRKTKIIATLGPATDDFTTIKKMAQAGMDIVRLNFSHGDYAHHKKIIETVRKVEADLGRKIEILLDLQGPKIRVGVMKEKVILKKGEDIILSKTKYESAKTQTIQIPFAKLFTSVNTKSIIFINDGKVELQVKKVSDGKIYCKVTTGGVVDSKKGINVINSTLKIPTITKKDKEDLIFCLKFNIDYVALSFVKNAKDIKQLRELIKKKSIKIIAKIETIEAVQEDTLEEIIIHSDGVMVARGDLGVEVRPEYLPLLQKHIIYLTRKYKKFAITATQMLQSMINSSTPSRAEVSDIANAILDHTNALMLSNETSVGKHPVKAVQMMKKIALVIEKEMKRSFSYNPNDNPLDND